MKTTMERCPQCFKYPKRWKEKPAYEFHELWCIGCRKHGLAAEGITQWIAEVNWNRLARRWKFDHCKHLAA